MNWFRFYHAALDDPKVQRLEPTLFKTWVNLLCLASEERDRGVLPPLDDIAFRLRLRDEETETMVWALIERGLIDDDGGRLMIHNWNQRQFGSDTSAERTRRYRDRLKTPVTSHETSPKRHGDGLDKNRERVREREEAAASSVGGAGGKPLPPPSIYAKTLDGALTNLESLFQDVDKQFSPTWLAKELDAAAAVVGPLTRKQLGEGLSLALNQLKRQMDAGKVSSPRPFAHRLIVDYLTEQRDDHHAA